MLSLNASAQDYNVTTTPQCNNVAGGNEIVNFTGATPNAIGNGTLVVYFRGDFDGKVAGGEYMDVLGEGSSTILGTTTSSTTGISNTQCAVPYDSIVISVPMASINTWASDGTISFTADAASGVSASLCYSPAVAFCVYMRLQYPRASGLNDIGVASVDTPGVFCAGSQNIWVTVKNYGINQITSATVNWTWNGVAQTPLSINQLIDTAQGASPNSLQVMLGTKTITDADTLIVWTSNPNGGVDTTNRNDTITKILAPSLMGAYTINAAAAAGGTNYQSFTTLVNDLSQYGICGPVTVNISGGPYTEQVTIPQIVGSSAVNTITFNGNGDTLKFAGTATAPWTLGLNGADHITFNNLNVVGTNTTNALVGHLWNQADSNTFNSCTFRAPATTTSTTAVAFSVSGAAASPTTTGPSGDGNTLNNCIMFSGYYNTVFYGNSAAANTGNKVINCKLEDYYVYGLYAYYQTGMVITGDTIQRPTRTTLSTFYGMYITTGSAGFLVEKNVIRHPFTSTPTSTSTAYGIYMAAAATAANEHKFYNNLIHLSTGNGTKYGLYLGGNYARAYHNTVVIDNTTSSGSSMYGLYASGTTGMAIRNNNVVITQPGTATKYGLYYSGTGKNSNYNNIFINSTGGTNYLGYYSTTSTGAANLAAWQAVASNAFDSASVSLDPMFASGSYIPTNGLLDDKGTSLGITTDINGATRNATTPDIGAYEFSVPGCSGTPTAGTATGPASGMVCPNNPFTLSLSGVSVGTGITIQWESSPAGAGSWTAISNATSSTYGDPGINTPMDYRAVVTCANGGAQDISNTISLGISPVLSCYCTPSTGGGTTYYISGFSTTGAASNINSTSSSGTASGYKDLTAQPALVVVPGTTFNYTMNIAGGSTYGAAIWIDTNVDGTFQANEQFLTTSSYAASPISGAITIPATTMTGMTRMRILAAFTPANPTNPCLNSGSGEYQDFMINIFMPSTCSGTPTAGTAFGVPDSICAGRPILLSDTSATLATGITYQWQQSPHAAGTWTDIAGATTASYNLTAGVSLPTDFRLVVSCSASGLGDTSNVDGVSYIYPATQCYCVPTTGGGTTYYISGFTTTGAVSNISSTSSSGTASGYKDLTGQPPLVVTPGTAFNYTMNIAGGSTYGAAIWIDTNMDGTFQANEQFLTTSAYAASPISGTVTIPASATSGTTRMRILAAFTPANPTNPCLNSGTGEYNDFTFVIGPPPTCPAPTALTATNATATSVDLSWTSTASQWQLEYAPGTTFTPGTGTRVGPAGLTNPFTLTGLTGQAYSFFVRNICTPGDTSLWSQRQVFFPVPPNDDCINAIDISNGLPVNGYVSNATQSQTACDLTSLANDVWYTFTTGSAATTATINVNTTTTGTDIVIQAFSGTCGTLTPMIPTTSSGTGTNGCVDGPAAGLETATYTVTPNTTYYVRVYGYNTAQGTFPIRLAIPPANDDICNATNLVIDDPVPSCVNTESATVGASDPANSCSSNNNTVWYKFTPTVSKVYYLIATVPATSADPLGAWLFTYTATGTCPGTLTLTAAGGIGTTCQSSAYPASAGSVTSFTTASLTANTTYYLFVDGNSGDIGDICFQVLSNPLAIKLTDITAVNLGNRNRINWISAEESKGDYYELERSADGKDFVKLARVDGKAEAATYTYWDEQPLNGTNHYRLKMSDAAGNTSYSKVVTVNTKATTSFGVEAYPNPVSNNMLTVVAYGTDDKNATVLITDFTGKVIKAVSMTNGMVQIDMNGLAQGMYLVKYTDNSHTQTIKVSKQ